jgi:hypothetical protein
MNLLRGMTAFLDMVYLLSLRRSCVAEASR